MYNIMYKYRRISIIIHIYELYDIYIKFSYNLYVANIIFLSHTSLVYPVPSNIPPHLSCTRSTRHLVTDIVNNNNNNKNRRVATELDGFS